MAIMNDNTVDGGFRAVGRRAAPAFVFSLLLCLPCQAKNVIISIQPDSEKFIETFNSLKVELSGDFEVKPFFISRKNSPDDILKLLRREQPKCLVLMDNTAIAMYRKIQSTGSDGAFIIPSVATMGIMIGDAIKGLKNACGISYEVPVVTSVVNLRSILASPVNRVGIIHRPYLTGFLQKNTRFCSREKIELISIIVSKNEPDFKKQLKKAFRLIKKQKVDAFWVPNDNILLRSDYFSRIWIPKVKRLNVPVIVGIEALVNPVLDFGTLAVLPDHAALGKQTANLIFEIMENDGLCPENRVEPALSVIKIINMDQALGTFGISEKNLGTIDKKLE